MVRGPVRFPRCSAHVISSLRLAEVAVAVSKVLSTANRYAAGLHRSVARILLFDMDEYHTRIPFKEPPALRRASALGQIDGWMVKDWVNPEEWLYPLVQEALTAWSTAHQ